VHHPRLAASTLVLLTTSLALAGCGGESDDAGPVGPPRVPSAGDLDGDGLSDDDELALARQFRPYWDLDPVETVFPISVEEWAEFGGTVTSAGGTTRTYRDLATLHAAVLAAPDGVMTTAVDPFGGAPPCTDAVRCSGAPIYADAVPVSFTLAGRSDLVWLHYWLFFHHDFKQTPLGTSTIHIGDWEHVCVLVAREDRGRLDAPPVGLHYHHHGSLDVVDTAPAWHADPLGARHGRVYVESGTHGMYPRPDRSFLGAHRGGGVGDGLLAHPIAMITPHTTNASSTVDEVLATFRGRWGSDGTEGNLNPLGPLEFNQPCDHDWRRRPARSDWLPACRNGAP